MVQLLRKMVYSRNGRRRITTVTGEPRSYLPYFQVTPCGWLTVSLQEKCVNKPLQGRKWCRHLRIIQEKSTTTPEHTQETERTQEMPEDRQIKGSTRSTSNRWRKKMPKVYPLRSRYNYSPLPAGLNNILIPGKRGM